MTTLKKLHAYFTAEGLIRFPYQGVLSTPKRNARNIYPILKQTEIQRMMEQIDVHSAVGKRDRAILYFVAYIGLRAGDIANLKLCDIDWKTRNLHIAQSKTGKPLCLPLMPSILSATADYLLHARPESNSPYMFLRSLAPYQQFKDGVSIACIFRQYLKKAGIHHVKGDGRTFHGFRRMIATTMVVEGTPVDTIAEVLGHTHTRITNRYISLDVKGLRQYALSCNPIDRGGSI